MLVKSRDCFAAKSTGIQRKALEDEEEDKE